MYFKTLLIISNYSVGWVEISILLTKVCERVWNKKTYQNLSSIKLVAVWSRSTRLNLLDRGVGGSILHMAKFNAYTLRKTLVDNKCMTKMENFAGSKKVAHILKVWSLLSTKIPISSRSVKNSSVMSHSPAAPLVLTNSEQFFPSWISLVILCFFYSLHCNLSEK